MLEGIDVSNWQRKIDWQAVQKAGKAFAAIKATEGVGYVDPYYLYNYWGARNNGIATITYHYARPDQNEAYQEASFFVKSMGGATFNPGDMIALDIETGRGDLSEWVSTWLDYVEFYCNIKPLIYTSPWYLQTLGLQAEALATYGLWLASWQDAMPAPPAPWPVIAFWQYSASGACPGINGAVDLDRFNGAVEQMALYGLQK